jgi:signal transduction histidine kinase/ActR/RegA family two-component response regulator
VRGQAYFDGDGRAVRCIGTVRDVTAEKRAETEREALLAIEREAREQAEEANRLKDEFLATVSHELRTPLNAILGWSLLLYDRRVEGDAALRALETIDRNARALAQLVEDLLDVSRIISGKLRLEVETIEPAPCIEAAIETLEPAASAKGIRVTTALDRHAGPVSGDPARLQQIVWNLLSNAIKFTPRGGHVEVKLSRVASHVEITIEDSGQGIAPEFLPHVFDRFRQADGATTRSHGGLGLGLAIVRHLVEAHGGSIEAASEGKGRGATFTVSLPIAAVRPDSRPSAAVEPGEEHRLDGVRVLVVDDEEDARALVAIVVEQRGAEVASAGSAAEALALLETFRPDVLVSDIGMPGRDGYDLIRAVRALPPERGGRTPAVALTAYARVEDRVRAIRAGYQLHVPKPVEPEELVVVVASLAANDLR